MTDQVLNILKYVLLALLYLFFARVLWAVWSEVRAPVRRATPGARAQQPGRSNVVDPAAPTVPASRPTAPVASTPTRKRRRSARASGGPVTRLVLLEPAARRGLSVGLTGEITIGREPGCSIVIDDDAFVSQHHLRVFDYDGQPMVEDLGSTNGTYHNGVKLVGAKLLHVGDRIQLGTTVIEAQ